MLKVALLTIAVLVALAGCAHRELGARFKRGEGDAAQVILQHSIKRGGSPTNTNNLPVLTGKWHFFEDEYGVVIHLPRDQYDAVKAMFYQAYGQPKLGPTEFEDGGRLAVYRLTPKGGGIQFGRDENVTFVNIIRPLSSEESAESLGRAFQDKEFRKALEKSDAIRK